MNVMKCVLGLLVVMACVACSVGGEVGRNNPGIYECTSPIQGKATFRFDTKAKTTQGWVGATCGVEFVDLISGSRAFLDFDRDVDYQCKKIGESKAAK